MGMAAVEAIGRGEVTSEAVPFSLPVDLGGSRSEAYG
jgi:hypothetical protein